jgi:hypothetical protein
MYLCAVDSFNWLIVTKIFMLGEAGRYRREIYSDAMRGRDEFGEVEVTPELTAELEQLPRDERGRISDVDALRDVVRRHQPGDPASPVAGLARDLRLALGDKLRFSDDELDRILTFTSVGTPLARNGEVGWLEVGDAASGRRQLVTVGFRNRDDEDNHAVDVALGEMPDHDADEYLDAVDAAAQRVIGALESRHAPTPGSGRRPAKRQSIEDLYRDDVA